MAIPDANLIALTPIVNQTELDALTQETLTTTQYDALNHCAHGLWTNIAEAAGKTGEGSYNVEEDIMNSGIELSRRNTTTNARTRYRLATYYDADVAYLVTCDHASTNTLAVTALTAIKSDLWVDGKPDWAVYQNRAFMVNGVGDGVGTPDRIWTDGVNVHNIGITAPGTTAVYVSDSASGGYLEDGVYRFKYSYYRSTDYGAESNLVTGHLETTLANGGSTQSVTITFVYSAEDQVDKLRIYRTKLGDTATYYYEQQFANVDGTGTVNKVCGTVADASLATLASESGLGTGNERPVVSNYIAVAANRMWYATGQYVYYSQLGYPEQVPSENQISFDPDDGEDITNLSAFANYILVQKNTKTWIVDANNPDYVKPIQLSNNIGTIAKRSSSTSVNGQLFTFLSQEGFYVTDGVQMKSICEGKIYRDLMQNIDKSKMAYAEGMYYPNDMQYMCYTPYLNDQYRFWVYSFTGQNWVDFTWDFRPHSITLWTDENDIKRLVIGTFLKGVESGRRSYFGHFIQADYEHWKDVDMSNTCGGSAVTYQSIPMTVITSWDNMDTPDKEKYFYSFHTDWENNTSNSVSAVVTMATDFGRNTDAGTITHAGIVSEPSEDDWQHGYKKIQGWDYQSNKNSDASIGELHGKNLSVKFYETSQNFVRVYGHMIDYKIRTESRKE